VVRKDFDKPVKLLSWNAYVVCTKKNINRPFSFFQFCDFFYATTDS